MHACLAKEELIYCAFLFLEIEKSLFSNRFCKPHLLMILKFVIKTKNSMWFHSSSQLVINHKNWLLQWLLLFLNVVAVVVPHYDHPERPRTHESEEKSTNISEIGHVSLTRHDPVF